MDHHLVVIEAPYIAAMFAGRKSVECRLSKRRIVPFGGVQSGDVLWIKEPGGPVVAMATARRVRYWSDLTPTLVRRIRLQYGRAIAAGPQFFSRHRNAKFGTLLLIGRVRRVSPIHVRKRDRRAWVILDGPPVPTVLASSLGEGRASRGLPSVNPRRVREADRQMIDVSIAT